MSVAEPSHFPPPPECMQPDDPSAAESARSRLSKKRSFLNISLPTFTRNKSKRDVHKESEEPHTPLREHYEPQSITEPGLWSPRIAAPDLDDDVLERQLVRLEDGFAYANVELDEDYDKDVYRWAVLYENQRGATIFSTPYYSPLSLLPMDPPPFTIPTDSPSPRRGQPTVSLSSYPLPDGTWHWVSRAWMVDMRGDGQTQYDGFEYNWFFRGKKWRAQVGQFNAGGWVRRRRWVRLMMRPAKTGKSISAPSSGKSTPGDIPHHDHSNSGTTRPPSVVLQGDDEDPAVEEAEVWCGIVEEDWARCHMVVKRLERDGRKLELWTHWLDPRPQTLILRGNKGKQKMQQSSSSSSHGSSTSLGETFAEETGNKAEQVPPEYIAGVLRSHGTEIIQSFIYPESRAQFVELLARSNLLPDLQLCAGGLGGTPLLDFWSYSSSLDSISKGKSGEDP